MTGEPEITRQSPSALEQLRDHNQALRRQVVELREKLALQRDAHRNANKAKDALITRLQFELSDIESGAGDLEARIIQLTEENDRLRDALVAAASQ